MSISDGSSDVCCSDLPQVELPRDSEEQSFIYPWGGPFEASEVLHGEFSYRFDEATIMAAVKHIERDGTVEWAPTSHGDFYEHPDPEPEEETEATRVELTGRILDRLDQQIGRASCRERVCQYV